jgi:hypothetical protein
MTPEVDILVTNRDTLPWLKLQCSQINRLKPKVPFRYFVWDNQSRDGTKEWLAATGTAHEVAGWRLNHSQSLSKMLTITSSPIIAFMDSDAIPVVEGWLDEAVSHLQRSDVGAAGLRFGVSTDKGQPLSRRSPEAGAIDFKGELPHLIATIHPSLLVMRRDFYREIGGHVEAGWFGKNGPCERGAPGGEFFDVAMYLGRQIRRAGYHLRFLGDCGTPEKDQKVIHAYGGSNVLFCDWRDANKNKQVLGIAKRHLNLLARYGLESEFLQYVRGVSAVNPFASRYFGENPILP